MMQGPRDYRSVFERPGEASHFDSVVYAPGSFYDWVWGKEKGYLRDVIQRRLAHRSIDHLDFACGPGRIIGFLRPLVARATGIDVSGEALDIAATRVPDATLIQGDATQDSSLLRGPYNLITAFRFFLHAQPALRRSALGALGSVLAPDGLLIFNVHGNAHSVRTLGLWFRRRLQRRTASTLSIPEVDRMVRQRGLRILEIRGVSLLPRPLYPLTPRLVWDGLDRLVERRPALHRYCTNIIFVCGRADGSLRRPG